MTTSSPPTERLFGKSVGSVCLVAGALMWWRGYTNVGPVLTGAGGLLVVLGLLAPALLRRPNRVWWRFAQALGWFNTRVLLTLFFAVVLTPVGVLMRVFGRNPLRPLRADTNWQPYSTRRGDPKHYEHLF